MRSRTTIVTLLVFLTGLLGIATFSNAQTLQELYKTGKISLEEALRIDYDSFPEEAPLKGISGFAVTKNGNIFVSDMQLNHLKILDASGKYIKTVGQKGAGPGDLSLPWHLVYNGKHVYVYEIRNRRYSLFNEDGSFFKIIKQPNRNMLKKLRVLSSGDLIIETEVFNYGQNIGQEALVTLYSPELKEKKLLYKRHVLTNKFITEPTRINVIQPFQPLVSWDIAKNGDLIVAFQDKYEIERHHLEKGKISSFTHKHTPVPVTEKDKEKFFAMQVTSSRDGKTIKGAPKYVRDNTDFPKYKPIFEAILTDPDGNILVFPTLPSSNTTEMVFDAFTPEGTFISRATCPIDFPHREVFLLLAHFHNGYLWSMFMDEDDEFIVVKYKIDGIK